MKKNFFQLLKVISKTSIYINKQINKLLGNAEIQLLQKQLNKRKYNDRFATIPSEESSIFFTLEENQLMEEDISLRKKIKLLERRCLQWQIDYEILEEENYELRRKLEKYENSACK